MGNRRKLGVVRASIHRPGLRVLDEPTSRLDPLGLQEFRAMAGEARDRGQTVLSDPIVIAPHDSATPDVDPTERVAVVGNALTAPGNPGFPVEWRHTFSSHHGAQRRSPLLDGTLAPLGALGRHGPPVGC